MNVELERSEENKPVVLAKRDVPVSELQNQDLQVTETDKHVLVSMAQDIPGQVIESGPEGIKRKRVIVIIEKINCEECQKDEFLSKFMEKH